MEALGVAVPNFGTAVWGNFSTDRRFVVDNRDAVEVSTEPAENTRIFAVSLSLRCLGGEVDEYL